MKSHEVILALLVSAFTFACGGDDASVAGDTPDAAAVDASVFPAIVCEDRVAQPLDSQWTIVSGGIERTMLVHVPAMYDPASGAPLVLNFHGYTSNATQQELLTGMNDKSDIEGFISVHPEGTGVVPSWNAGECCGEAQENDVDDVQFVRDMLNELETRLCIDTTRVYATGLSNGGFMSHRLACDLSERIAAIGPVAGQSVQLVCEPTRPVPVAHFHGTLDAVVPYEGNPGIGLPSVEDSISSWAERNGCGENTEEIFNTGDSICEAYTDCPSGGEVILCTVDGGGHTWPGGIPVPALGYTTTDLSATDFMWDFFERHQLASGD